MKKHYNNQPNILRRNKQIAEVNEKMTSAFNSDDLNEIYNLIIELGITVL